MLRLRFVELCSTELIFIEINESVSSLRGRYRRLLCFALVGPSVENCCLAWYHSLLEEFKRALGVLQRKIVCWGNESKGALSLSLSFQNIFLSNFISFLFKTVLIPF